MIQVIVNYILQWLSSIAIAWFKKESKINKNKKSIDDQVTRLNKAVDALEKGEKIDQKEIINAARDLANNF